MTFGLIGDNSPSDGFTDRDIREMIGEKAADFYRSLQNARMVNLHRALLVWERLSDLGKESTPRPTLDVARDLPVWVECVNLAKTHVVMVLRLSTDPDQPAITPESPACPGLPNS